MAQVNVRMDDHVKKIVYAVSDDALIIIDAVRDKYRRYKYEE